MGTLKDFKYKIVRNFLTQDELKLISEYCIIRHRFNHNYFDETNKNFDTCYYADPIMESLMITKKNLMEKETGLKLLPTYTLWRMYTQYADLFKHKDRESCEISATIKINSDGTSWPFIVENRAIELTDGDAVLYLGCEVMHGREDFQGKWNTQAFLHYVDKDGPYADWYLDKRPMLGSCQL